MRERTYVKFHQAGLPVMFVYPDVLGICGTTRAVLIRLVSPNAILPGDWT